MSSLLPSFGKRRRRVPTERDHLSRIKSENAIALTAAIAGSLIRRSKVQFVGAIHSRFDATCRRKEGYDAVLGRPGLPYVVDAALHHFFEMNSACGLSVLPKAHQQKQSKHRIHVLTSCRQASR